MGPDDPPTDVGLASPGCIVTWGLEPDHPDICLSINLSQGLYLKFEQQHEVFSQTGLICI